jgi:putative heme-binding domain-containing protein
LGRLLEADDQPGEHETHRFVTAAAISSVNKANLGGLIEFVFAAKRKAPRAELVGQLVSLAIALDETAALSGALESVVRPSGDGRAGDRYAAWQFAAAASLFDALDRSHRTLERWAKHTGGRLDGAIAGLRKMSAAARATVQDVEADEADRRTALGLLGHDDDQRNADVAALAAILVPQTPLELQAGSVAKLTTLGDDRTADLLLAGWNAHGPELRGRVVDALLTRRAWTSRLVEQMSAGDVPPGEIDAARRQRLLEHESAAVREKAQRLFAGAVNKDRAKVVANFRPAAQLPGDAQRGAAVFKKHCAACHRLTGMGHAVGPDLSALTDRSPEAMLTAIFDPNRAVEARYLDFTAVTDDGLVHRGMLAAETGNSVTLLAAEGKQEQLLRNQIESLASSAKSLMPEGLEKDVEPQDVADLLNFLGGFKPPRKTFEGNQPVAVRPDALRGEFWLLASQCEIYGSTLVFEPQYRNLGFWQSADDHVTWTLEAADAGEFAVSLDYACDDATAGQALAVEVAGQRLVAKVRGTGNWDTYKTLSIGKVKLDPGEHRLTVRPDGPLGGALVDLKAVRLRPVK